MNVSVLDELKEFVEAQVQEHGYVSSSEFLCELIRREQDRAQLRRLLLQGMEFGPQSEINRDHLDRLRERSDESDLVC